MNKLFSYSLNYDLFRNIIVHPVFFLKGFIYLKEQQRGREGEWAGEREKERSRERDQSSIYCIIPKMATIAGPDQEPATPSGFPCE